MNSVVIYGIKDCPYCKKVLALFKDKRIGYEYTLFTDLSDEEQTYIKETKAKTATTYPIIFINDVYVGGFDNVNAIIG